MSCCAAEREISVTGFGTSVFMSEVVGGRAPQIFDIVDRAPQHLGQECAFGIAITVQVGEARYGIAQDSG